MAVWSEVKSREVADSGRLDADYWRPEYIQNETDLRAMDSRPLETYTEFIRSGPFGSNLLCESYLPEGVLVIRPFNIDSFTLTEGNLAYIPESGCVDSRLHFYQKNDLVFSRVGDIRVGIIEQADSKITISPNIIAVRVRHGSIDPLFLTAYMNSKQGLLQLERGLKVVAQPTITVEWVKSLLVPNVSEALQARVATLVRASFQKRKEAASRYAEAEGLLIESLGIKNLDLSHSLFYERPYRDVSAARRADAEYFQPRYDALVSAMNAKKGRYRLVGLGALSAPLKYGCSTKLEYLEEGRPFLRIADLDNKRFQLASVLHVSAATPFGLSDLVLENDVLISRSGTLGVAVPITKEFAGSAYGSYFIRTRPDSKIIHPEFLALFINSIAGQVQVERKTSGGVQTNLTIPAIQSLIVPLGDPVWQEQFVALVESSLEARRESLRLLDQAKQQVEAAMVEGA